jgi:hypothetical protein
VLSVLSLLAGGPAARPAPVAPIAWTVVLFLVVGGFFTVAAVRASGRRRDQTAGRDAASAQDVTGCWAVRMRTEDLMAVHGPGMNSGTVNLRGEFIEVTHSFSLGRALNGWEFHFPVREARLSIDPGAFGRQWLVITGTSSGRPASVAVSLGNRAALEQMWHVLTAAGARPERPQP